MGFFVILIGVFRTKEDWLQLFQMVIIAGWIQTGYVLAQIFDLPLALKTYSSRPGGSLGNSAFLATYLVFIIFIAAYLYTQTKSLKIKLGYGTLILLDLFLVWQTETRGAILALLFGFIFLVGVNFWREQAKKVKIILGLILAMIPFVIVILVINKDVSWVRSSPTLNRLVTISPNDITTQNRLIVWGAGYQAFSQRPILGWGWENFYAAFNQNFDPLITRDVGSQPWYDRTHNVVVETVVATGLVGLIIYLAIIIWAIKLLVKQLKTDQKLNQGVLLLINLIIVYFLQNLFVFDTINSYILFILILAFIQFKNSKPLAETVIKPVVHQQNKTIILVILVLAIMTPFFYFFNLRPALANYYTVQAVVKNKTSPVAMLAAFKKSFNYSSNYDQELRFILVQHTRDQINLRGVTPETIPLIEFAISEMNQSIKASPEAVQNYLILAELYLAAAKLDPDYWNQAEQITLMALAKAPNRYQVYTMLGRLNMVPGKFAQGIDYFKQATVLNPNFAEAYWNLAIAYILTWQPELAQKSLDRALALGFDIYQPRNIDRLLLAYRDSKNLEATIDFLESLTQRFPDNQYYAESLKSLKEIQQ